VIEGGEDDPFRGVSVVQDTHGSCPSSDLSEGPFYEVSRTKFSPQELLGFLKSLGTKTPMQKKMKMVRYQILCKQLPFVLDQHL
jgi:hypothetical protein